MGYLLAVLFHPPQDEVPDSHLASGGEVLIEVSDQSIPQDAFDAVSQAKDDR